MFQGFFCTKPSTIISGGFLQTHYLYNLWFPSVRGWTTDVASALHPGSVAVSSLRRMLRGASHCVFLGQFPKPQVPVVGFLLQGTIGQKNNGWLTNFCYIFPSLFSLLFPLLLNVFEMRDDMTKDEMS